MLVLKAARGGGMPLGHAEDLCKAAAFLDLEAMTTCPCSGQFVAALDLPLALDRLLAGLGPQTVQVEPTLVAAYCAVVMAEQGRSIDWRMDADQGRVVLSLSNDAGAAPRPLGRRLIPDTLRDHLEQLAAQILVPETAASRAAGAGAGLTDND